MEAIETFRFQVRAETKSGKNTDAVAEQLFRQVDTLLIDAHDERKLVGKRRTRGGFVTNHVKVRLTAEHASLLCRQVLDAVERDGYLMGEILQATLAVHRDDNERLVAFATVDNRP